MCKKLGVPLALEKTEGPSHRLTFLGIELDSEAQTLSLPAGKLEEIKILLASFKRKKSCSKKELQSLIGSLVFASKCIPASRIFTRRIDTAVVGHARGLFRQPCENIPERWFFTGPRLVD